MKNKDKKILLILVLLLITISLIKYKQNDILNYLVQLRLNKIESEEQYKNSGGGEGLEPEFDADNVEEATIEDYFQNIGKFSNVKYDGRLVIPSINLNLPIFQGVNSTHLLLGASEQVPRSEISAGQYGNYILASHRMSNTRNLGFARINRIKTKSKVYVTDDNYMYVYNVVFNKTVNNNDTKYINEQPKDKKIITLYTCSKFGKNTPKVVVRGELEDYKLLRDLNPVEYDMIYKKN